MKTSVSPEYNKHIANWDENINTILYKVQESLTSCLLETKNQKIRSFETIQILQRPFSIVAFLRVQASYEVKRYVTKIILHHPINKSITDRENQAVVEYNILRMLYPKFQNVDNCSVPRPVLVIPDIETYVMEFVQGSALVDNFRYVRFFSSLAQFCTLLENVRLCGKWLRYFQEFTGAHLANSRSIEGVIERAEQRLQLIEEANDPRCPKELVKTMRRYLYRYIEQIRYKEIMITGRHGDFTPWNILVGPKGITVIDFLGYQEDLAPVDVYKMLVYLEDESHSITSSSKRVKDLKIAFLDGYGKPPNSSKPILFVCEAMQRIVSLWGCISSTRIHLHHRLELNRQIKNHIKWLINGDEINSLWHYNQS